MKMYDACVGVQNSVGGHHIIPTVLSLFISMVHYWTIGIELKGHLKPQNTECSLFYLWFKK